MSKCYLLFAEGFEECEGLVTLDILRRAGLEAYTVSIQDAHTVVGAHGVPITCDRTLPEVLAQYGLLAGRRATCYPGFENRCTGAHMVDADVVTDGPITTGRALGAAMAFALELVRLLTDEQTAARTAEEIVWRT